MRIKTRNPRVYPLDRSLQSKWFIKYQLADYSSGSWVWKKYCGILNLFSTVEDRLNEAAKYITLIENGEQLPVFKGARRIPAPDAPANFANTVQLLNQYLKERTDIDGITISNYKSKIKGLHEWLHVTNNNTLPIGQFGTVKAKRFMEWLKKVKKLQNKTCNHYKGALSKLWDDMIIEEIIEVNPWRQFRGLPKSSVPFRAHPEWLQNKIKKTLPEFNEQLYMASMVVYYDFIRPAEMRRLHLYNIEWDLQCFRLTSNISKSKNDRLIVIPDDLFEMLIEKGYNNMDPELYLFTKKGIPGINQIGKNWFNRKFRTYREKFKIPHEFKIYGLKHTGNSRLGISGVTPQLQQNHNRHESMNSIRPYITGISYEDMSFIRQMFPKFGSKIEALSKNNNSTQLAETMQMVIKQISELKKIVESNNQDAIHIKRPKEKGTTGTTAIA